MEVENLVDFFDSLDPSQLPKKLPCILGIDENNEFIFKKFNDNLPPDGNYQALYDSSILGILSVINLDNFIVYVIPMAHSKYEMVYNFHKKLRYANCTPVSERYNQDKFTIFTKNERAYFILKD